ncbi:MAG: hypothetical protein LBE55_00725 [Clostridiales bacterium]|nr:hypothetical protein [Clostridiales bacterium]
MSRKLLTALLISSFGIFASASLYASEINVDIGFEQVEFRGQGPTIVDGRTLVPIREVFQGLGFFMHWNPSTQTATLSGQDAIVTITVGSDIFTINSTEFPLEVPAQIIGDSTMLPIRPLLEAIGYYVGFNATTRTVQISHDVARGIDHRPADNFRNFITDYAFLDWGVIVMEYQPREDGGILWATQFRTGNLLKSTDQGESWAPVYEFIRPINAIYADDYGNIFVATTLDRWAAIGTAELFKSSDGGETFQKVLDIAAGAPMRWNITSRGGMMFVSEYGYKWLPNNARHIYRSLDFGETWTTIYTPPQILDYHNHKILMTADGIIYQAVGDGQNAQIIRSVDNGYNWTQVISGFQPTSGIAFENHILWGLDGGPWMGIARYDRHTGEMTRAFTLPPPFFGPAYDMIMAHNIIYTAFLSYGGYEFPASIWYSRDEGETWHLLGYIEKSVVHQGIGLNHIVANGEYAFIDIGGPIYRDGEAELFRGTLRIRLLNVSE